MKINSKEDAKMMMDELVAQYPVVKPAMADIYIATCDGAEVEDIEIGDTAILIEGSVAGVPASWTVEIATGNIIDTYNAERDMEDEEMIDTTAATREEVEVTLGDKAREFAEASKEKLENGFKFVVENIGEAKEIVEDMADMSSEELEDYLKDNAKGIFDKLMEKIKSYRNDMKEGEELFPNLKTRYMKCDNIIDTIREVLDDDTKKGWGKFKEIVKSLIVWIVKLFVKVAAIVLKLAFTVIVGAIKIGCTTVTTAVKVAKVANAEIIKPAVKTGKGMWNVYKERRDEKKARMEAAREELWEDDFDDFEEEVIIEPYEA